MRLQPSSLTIFSNFVPSREGRTSLKKLSISIVSFFTSFLNTSCALDTTSLKKIQFPLGEKYLGMTSAYIIASWAEVSVMPTGDSESCRQKVTTTSDWRKCSPSPRSKLTIDCLMSLRPSVSPSVKALIAGISASQVDLFNPKISGAGRCVTSCMPETDSQPRCTSSHGGVTTAPSSSS